MSIHFMCSDAQVEGMMANSDWLKYCTNCNDLRTESRLLRGRVQMAIRTTISELDISLHALGRNNLMAVEQLISQALSRLDEMLRKLRGGRHQREQKTFLLAFRR